VNCVRKARAMTVRAENTYSVLCKMKLTDVLHTVGFRAEQKKSYQLMQLIRFKFSWNRGGADITKAPNWLRPLKHQVWLRVSTELRWIRLPCRTTLDIMDIVRQKC